MAKIDQILNFFKHTEEEKQYQALAKKYKLPYVYLVGHPIPPNILNLIPPETAREKKLVAYLKSGKIIKVATTDPGSKNLLKTLEDLKKNLGFDFSLSLCSNSSLNYALAMYNQADSQKSLGQATEIVGTEKTTPTTATEIKNLADLKDKIQKVPTTQVLEVLFTGALVSEATDIHLEPQEKEAQVRYRIDGILHNIAKLPLNVYQTLNSRIKYLAHLKLDVKDMPQDGEFEITSLGKKIDVRVSTLPAVFGEVIEMRILPKEKKFLSLDQLGFTPEHIKIIRQAIHQPQGIIFNTGPTGSGKTTTLYAILSELNKPGVKIITLEDPIEYHLKGIEQSQIKPEKGYTFITALRSALRQDPDILMIGEIRDSETAATAIQAAMTGHLVLTTFHTNNAPATLPRLLDMGIKPYLLAGSINLIIAQRLVRKICPHCQGKGCLQCHNTGFRGRTLIAELLVPNQEIEDLIQKKASLRDFERTAQKTGMITMMEDGMNKVKQGITTKEEVLRVTKE